MKRGAILIALIVFSMGNGASGDEVAWQGTLSIDFLSLDPVHIEGVGVATIDGPGFSIDSLRLAQQQ